MGRKAKPPHLHVIDGTFRKDRHGEKPIVHSAAQPVAPAWMNERQRDHFARIVAMLHEIGCASASYTDAIKLLAIRFDEIESHQAVLALGRTYATTTAAGATTYRVRPEVAMLADAMKHSQSLLSELGLTPTTIGKINLERGAGGAGAGNAPKGDDKSKPSNRFDAI